VKRIQIAFAGWLQPCGGVCAFWWGFRQRVVNDYLMREIGNGLDDMNELRTRRMKLER
jgi:hypothetical protein